MGEKKENKTSSGQCRGGWRKEWQVGIIMALIGIVWFYGCDMMQGLAGTFTSAVGEITMETEEIVGPVIVIDPGHGSDDPGKVGINGALEKDINLAIALYLGEMLESQNYQVFFTREDDNGLLDGDSYSASGDLAARVDLINEIEPTLVVSIHQNSYTDASVKGPQVFYSSYSTEGEVAAQLVQNELWKLDLESKREIKSNDTYYLLAHSNVPTIIVECGFLSNANDADKLIDSNYQEEMAEAIMKGIETYIKTL